MRLWYLIFLILLSHNTLAQSPRLPIDFSQYNRILYQINPAYAGNENSRQLDLISRFHPGPFKNIRTVDAGGYINLDSKGRNTAGFKILNDREGSYIGRFRLHLLYAYHLKLSSQYKLSAGISLGFANFYIKPSDFTGGGSAFAPDGNIGLVLSNKRKFVIGLSISQLFNSKLQPIEEELELVRQINFFSTKQYAVAATKDIFFSVLVNYSGIKRVGVLSKASIQFNEILEAGLIYNHRNTLSVIAGLMDIELVKDNHMGLYISYGLPIVSTGVSKIQTIEVSLRYFKK